MFDTWRKTVLKVLTFSPKERRQRPGWYSSWSLFVIVVDVSIGPDSYRCDLVWWWPPPPPQVSSSPCLSLVHSSSVRPDIRNTQSNARNAECAPSVTVSGGLDSVCRVESRRGAQIAACWRSGPVHREKCCSTATRGRYREASHHKRRRNGEERLGQS